MQVVILSGGAGTRLSEENFLKPKPMIEIGGQPVLWHIMKYFSSFGHNDFLICLGYKQYMVKNYFTDYFIHTQDIEINIKNNSIKVLSEQIDDWNVKLVDTGLETKTAGRLKRVGKYLDEEFFIVYGDSLGDIDLSKEFDFFKNNGKILTLCATRFSNQKGVIDVDDNNVITSFREKSEEDLVYINSGYMISNKKILDYINDDNSALDKDVFPKLFRINQVNSYKHNGNWKMIEKANDVKELNHLWDNGNAFWKIW